MAREELVDAYLRGDVSRRTFIRRLVAGGISLGAAMAYTHSLRPGSTQAAPSANSHREDHYETPDVLTLEPSDVGDSSATLRGAANANGTPGTFYFQYGTTTAYSSRTPSAPLDTSPGIRPLSVAVNGLTPNTTYHVRIVGSNGSGAQTGDDKTFRTAGVPTQADKRGPQISASLLSTGIAAVLRTRRLKVKVRSNEAAVVALAATASQRVGPAHRVTVAKGRVRFKKKGTKTVRLKLTRAGRRRLKGRRKATLTLLSVARDAAGNRRTRKKKLYLGR